MSVPAIILPQARQDIRDIQAGYETLSQAVADRFVDGVAARIAELRQFPKLYGVFRGRTRAAPLAGFPHIIYYRDRGADILIVAVQHDRRSTRNWQRRG